VTASDEMACNELVELITDYLDDALPERDAARFEEHLADCPACVEFVEQFRRTISAVGRQRRPEVAPDTRARLLDVFRGVTGEQGR
jgi:anti-sigma factor RsiW